MARCAITAQCLPTCPSTADGTIEKSRPPFGMVSRGYSAGAARGLGGSPMWFLTRSPRPCRTTILAWSALHRETGGKAGGGPRRPNDPSTDRYLALLQPPQICGQPFRHDTAATQPRPLIPVGRPDPMATCRATVVPAIRSATERAASGRIVPAGAPLQGQHAGHPAAPARCGRVDSRGFRHRLGARERTSAGARPDGRRRGRVPHA